MNSITPTVGRKVWFWCGNMNREVLDASQAFDATIVFVKPDGTVNVTLTDHLCGRSIAIGRVIRDYSSNDRHGHGEASFCTWMPYQLGQAAKTAAS